METALFGLAAILAATSALLCRRQRCPAPIETTEATGALVALREIFTKQTNLNNRPLNGAATLSITSDAPTPPGQPRVKRLAVPKTLCRIDFSYLDSQGQYSRRAVNVEACDHQFFAGNCLLNEEYKVFTWDDIVGFVLLDGPAKGEVVEVEEARTRIAALQASASNVSSYKRLVAASHQIGTTTSAGAESERVTGLPNAADSELRCFAARTQIDTAPIDNDQATLNRSK